MDKVSARRDGRAFRSGYGGLRTAAVGRRHRAKRAHRWGTPPSGRLYPTANRMLGTARYGASARWPARRARLCLTYPAKRLSKTNPCRAVQVSSGLTRLATAQSPSRQEDVAKAHPWAFALRKRNLAMSRFLHFQRLAAVENGGPSLDRVGCRLWRHSLGGRRVGERGNQWLHFDPVKDSTPSRINGLFLDSLLDFNGHVLLGASDRQLRLETSVETQTFKPS